MKGKKLIPLLSILLLFACNKADDLFDIMPENDLIALEGMDEAYDNALIYNDSLLLCGTDPTTCDAAAIAHFDELFHQFDAMFDDHHENYTHNNMDDDHHHEGGHNVRHGWMMDEHHGEEDEHGDEGDHEYEHNMETLEMMMELREMHEGVHPG